MRLTTWLEIGLITVLAVVDLQLAAWWFGLTTLELFAVLVIMAAGLLKAAMTAIVFVLASAV